MEQIQTLYDLECALTNLLRRLWDKYCGYIFLFVIVLALICYQWPVLYQHWTCKGWSYNSSGSSQVDEQMDYIKIQHIIRNGGIARTHEANPDDEIEYSWLEAKKAQMDSRRQVMRQLHDPFRDQIYDFELEVIR